MPTSCQSQAINEWLKEDSNCWIAIASVFVQRYEWEIALQKITLALTWQLRDGPPSPTTLSGRLYQSGVNKIDYAAVALEIALAAKAAEPSVHSTEALKKRKGQTQPNG